MLHSFAERPKQRRHRCKDPTKLDVNSLTGEERVPVVHRNTGRRVSTVHTALLYFFPNPMLYMNNVRCH